MNERQLGDQRHRSRAHRDASEASLAVFRRFGLTASACALDTLTAELGRDAQFVTSG
jgi:hypothetical protein